MDDTSTLQYLANGVSSLTFSSPAYIALGYLHSALSTSLTTETSAPLLARELQSFITDFLSVSSAWLPWA